MKTPTKNPAETEKPWVRLTADQKIPKGTEILIPKEVAWNSTHPTEDTGKTKRATKIKVQTTSSEHSPDVTWGGTGGYWRWCKKVECFYNPNQK